MGSPLIVEKNDRLMWSVMDWYCERHCSWAIWIKICLMWHHSCCGKRGATKRRLGCFEREVKGAYYFILPIFTVFNPCTRVRACKNIFDKLPSLAPLQSVAVENELALYLSTDCENITDPVWWWYEKRKTYPQLSHMATDYLSIPGALTMHSEYYLYSFLCIATSVDVGHLFSWGCLILSHTQSCLSVTSTQALLCLRSWSLMGLVQDKNVEAVAKLDEVDAQLELNRLVDIINAKF